MPCPKGTYLKNNECVTCPAGTYSNTIASSECKKCKVKISGYSGATELGPGTYSLNNCSTKGTSDGYYYCPDGNTKASCISNANSCNGPNYHGECHKPCYEQCIYILHSCNLQNVGNIESYNDGTLTISCSGSSVTCTVKQKGKPYIEEYDCQGGASQYPDGTWHTSVSCSKRVVIPESTYTYDCTPK